MRTNSRGQEEFDDLSPIKGRRFYRLGRSLIRGYYSGRTVGAAWIIKELSHTKITTLYGIIFAIRLRPDELACRHQSPTPNPPSKNPYQHFIEALSAGPQEVELESVGPGLELFNEETGVMTGRATWQQALARLADQEAKVDTIACLDCGQLRLQVRYIVNPDTRVGYALFWCSSCLHGISVSRVRAPNGLPTWSIDDLSSLNGVPVFSRHE